MKLCVLSGVAVINYSVLNVSIHKWTRRVHTDIKIWHLNNTHFLSRYVPLSEGELIIFKQFLLNLQSQIPCIFCSVVFPLNAVDDLLVNQHDIHIFYILYTKQLSPLIFGAQIKSNW
jgi:hypothetical protein